MTEVKVKVTINKDRKPKGKYQDQRVRAKPFLQGREYFFDPESESDRPKIKFAEAAGPLKVEFIGSKAVNLAQYDAENPDRANKKAEAQASFEAEKAAFEAEKAAFEAEKAKAQGEKPAAAKAKK